MRILVDVDGTLIDYNSVPRMAIVKLVHDLFYAGNTIHLASGGGVQYAEMWAQRLRLPDGIQIVPKFMPPVGFEYDIAIDDHPECRMGKIVLQVKEIEKVEYERVSGKVPLVRKDA